MKQIEGELSILQAFIGQVTAHRVGDKAFDAWLDQVRDVAHEVEDIMDEHAYLATEAMDTSSFFKRKFRQIKNLMKWQKIPNQISQVEARIQRIAEMRNRYGISVGELDKSNKLQHHNQLSMPDSAYLTDSSEIVGNVEEIERLTQWLVEDKQDQTLIAIFGMGGLGKTTIASSVYKDLKARRKFDCYAWVTISQTYETEQLLRKILDQLIDQQASMGSGFMTMSGTRLVEVLQNYLRDKKYFIVLDDVWDKDAWLFLNYAFAKCQGLPLAIVTIGSALSHHELEEQEWKIFYNQLSWQLANNPELNWISNVLNLSLHNLPSYLRSCFLYCSLYPEDYKIKRKLISKLWIAEGFVEERGDGTTMEEVAECYLTELTQRSLLHVAERNADGRARTFLMHDLVREVTSTIAKNEKFGIAFGDVGIPQGAYEARRLCIQKNAQSLNSIGSSQLRSFILFDTEVQCSWIYDVLSRFRLLRVLCLRFANIEQVPGVITELYNLHYLDLSHTKVKLIPASLGKLVNLQVLDLRFSYVEELPLELTMLTNLRHLYALIHDILQRSLDCFGATKIPGNICHLKNLQTLQIVSANIDLVSQLGNMKLMRSLAIEEVRQSYVAELWSSLTKMPNLRRLSISAIDMDEVLDFKLLKPLPNLKFFRLAGKLEAGVLPSIFESDKLTWLKLDWACLKEDPVSSLSHMSHLVDLLLYGSYGGEQLTFCAGWFPKLNYLQLAGMENLNWIGMEDGTMMSLNNLEFRGLCNLKVVPEGIRYIKTLHQMNLIDMSKEFLESMQGSGSQIVQHIPNIHTFESSNRDAVNDLHFVPYLVHKYGPGATKHAHTYWGSSVIRHF